MAVVTIPRTPWIDDDGSGTYGTVINNAEKTLLYNQIDAALAQLLPLSGGGSIAGNVGIQGVLTVNGSGHAFQMAATGYETVTIQNTAVGTGNGAQLVVQADTAYLGLLAFSSALTPAGYAQPNGVAIATNAAQGLVIQCHASAPLKFATNGTERMRINSDGSLYINTLTNPAAGRLVVGCDGASQQPVVAQNLSATNVCYFLYCLNSAAAACGGVSQSGATGVLFNTSSDARLKTDRGLASDLSALRAVAVHDFEWTADHRIDRGVFAQETIALFPRAVTAGSDERTDAGDLKQPWTTDYSKFVADLIVGFQQHDADLAALRAELATLKGSH